SRSSCGRRRRAAPGRRRRTRARRRRTRPSSPCRRASPLLAAGDGGEDRHLVPLVDRRIEALEEADVLPLDVDVDEAAEVAVDGDPLAEAVVALVETVEHLPDGRRLLDDRLGLTAGDSSEL